MIHFTSLSPWYNDRHNIFHIRNTLIDTFLDRGVVHVEFTASDYILHPLHSDDAVDTDRCTFTQSLPPGPEHTDPAGDNSSIDPLTNPSPAQVYFSCVVLQLSRRSH